MSTIFIHCCNERSFIFSHTSVEILNTIDELTITRPYKIFKIITNEEKVTTLNNCHQVNMSINKLSLKSSSTSF